MELTTIKEIMEKHNCTRVAALNRIHHAGIKAQGTKQINGTKYHIRLYPLEEVEKAFSKPTRVRRQKKCDLWKLSIFDFNLGHYMVKRVSLQKADALQLQMEMRALGEVARITPHVRER